MQMYKNKIIKPKELSERQRKAIALRRNRMTKKEKKAYLEDYNRCPKCHSQYIISHALEADGGTAWANVECSDCGAVWKDVYKLVDVAST